MPILKGVFMCAALYRTIPNADPACPVRSRSDFAWQVELPQPYQPLVVPPVAFEVVQEYEVLADRVHGRDAQNQPCYFAFRYVATQLRSDDDEVYYEVPVYVETLTSWRLQDRRWLTLHQTVRDLDRGERRCDLFFSADRPW